MSPKDDKRPENTNLTLPHHDQIGIAPTRPPDYHSPMPYDPHKHHRQSTRLKGYDYTQTGAYFITICVRHGACELGKVVDGVMHLSPHGRIATACWEAIPDHFPQVNLDAYIIMPNHVHGILWIINDDTSDTSHVGATHASPLPAAPHNSDRPKGPPKGSLGAIVGSFKSAATRRINHHRDTHHAPFWQRNYYDHIIRNTRALHAIRHYIHANPANWRGDQLHPQSPPNKFNQLWRTHP